MALSTRRSGSTNSSRFTCIILSLLLLLLGSLQRHAVLDEHDDEPAAKRRRLPRRSMHPKDHAEKPSQMYKTSTYWTKFITNPNVRIPSSLASDTFRDTFRVPWEMFEVFVRDGLSVRLGQNPNPKKASGRKSLPVELKILGCLRFMAIGCPWDELSDTTGCSAHTVRVFYSTHWTPWMLDTYYADNVRMHTEKEHLDTAAAIYSAAGIPGCVSSMDGVHIAWNNAPHHSRHQYIGACRPKSYVFRTREFFIDSDSSETFRFYVFPNTFLTGGYRIFGISALYEESRGPSASRGAWIHAT